jgi:hypothetical protein
LAPRLIVAVAIGARCSDRDGHTGEFVSTVTLAIACGICRE